jgi:hypothetical protein
VSYVLLPLTTNPIPALDWRFAPQNLLQMQTVFQAGFGVASEPFVDPVATDA